VSEANDWDTVLSTLVYGRVARRLWRQREPHQRATTDEAAPIEVDKQDVVRTRLISLDSTTMHHWLRRRLSNAAAFDCSTWNGAGKINRRDRTDEDRRVYKWRLGSQKVLFCSLAVLDPMVGHTMDELSTFISVLCHSDSSNSRSWRHTFSRSISMQSALDILWRCDIQIYVSSLSSSSTGSPVHVLMLSIQAVRGLFRLRAPDIVPCIIFFSFLMVWP